MKEIIKRLKETFPNAKIEICKQKGIGISLGHNLKSYSIIIDADKCKSIKEIQKKVSEFKKCDCIIVSSYNNNVYLIIIELTSKAKLEGRFEEKFINCFNAFENWLKNQTEYKDLKYYFYFFCVFDKIDTNLIKYLKSIKSKLNIKGKKKTIDPIKKNTCLSDHFSKNYLY